MFLRYFIFTSKLGNSAQAHVFPIRKKMYASMAGASLGGLLLFFGLNQLMLFDGITTYIIAALFILLGAYVGIFNYQGLSNITKVL